MATQPVPVGSTLDVVVFSASGHHPVIKAENQNRHTTPLRQCSQMGVK
jgi:hypothetical protein